MKVFHYADDVLNIHHHITSAPDPDKFNLHAHKNCELYFFLEGNGYYTVEGTDYPLQSGAIIVIREGEAHTLHIDTSAPYDRICINFPGDFLSAAKKEVDELFYNRPLGKDNMFLLKNRSLSFVFECMRRICECDVKGDVQNHVKVYLQAIIWELFHAKKSGKSPAPADLSDTSAAIRKILTYVNENLTVIENIETLEKEFFFSRSYINRIFKEATGTSAWDYILLKRLLLAQTLLQNGKPAAIVAAECGFGDYSSFYRQFKKHFGISPIEARKK